MSIDIIKYAIRTILRGDSSTAIKKNRYIRRWLEDFAPSIFETMRRFRLTFTDFVLSFTEKERKIVAAKHFPFLTEEDAGVIRMCCTFSNPSDARNIVFKDLVIDVSLLSSTPFKKVSFVSCMLVNTDPEKDIFMHEELVLIDCKRDMVIHSKSQWDKCSSDKHKITPKMEKLLEMAGENVDSAELALQINSFTDEEWERFAFWNAPVFYQNYLYFLQQTFPKKPSFFRFLCTFDKGWDALDIMVKRHRYLYLGKGDVLILKHILPQHKLVNFRWLALDVSELNELKQTFKRILFANCRLLKSGDVFSFSATEATGLALFDCGNACVDDLFNVN